MNRSRVKSKAPDPDTVRGAQLLTRLQNAAATRAASKHRTASLRQLRREQSEAASKAAAEADKIIAELLAAMEKEPQRPGAPLKVMHVSFENGTVNLNPAGLKGAGAVVYERLSHFSRASGWIPYISSERDECENLNDVLYVRYDPEESQKR